MEDNKINLMFEKNVFKFKILYLIRKNLPKSEFLYLLMFFLKYIGLILFGISLNVFDTRNNINNNSNNKDSQDRNNMHDNSDRIDQFLSDVFFRSDHSMKEYDIDIFNDESTNISSNNISNNNMVQKIFRKLLMNGDN